MDTFLSSMCTSHDNDLMLYILLLSWWVKTKPVDNNKKIALMMCFNNFFIFILWTVTFIVFISSGIYILRTRPTTFVHANDAGDRWTMGSVRCLECIVPQMFKLLPFLLYCFVRAIRFITNKKYAFFCIY